MAHQSNDPLHGVKLEQMLIHLEDQYGWDELADRIRIRCFANDPSLKSCLKFLRKTPWARNKVENLYRESGYLGSFFLRGSGAGAAAIL
jgi:uncharacterized protein (DUF2132 family)